MGGAYDRAALEPTVAPTQVTHRHQSQSHAYNHSLAITQSLVLFGPISLLADLQFQPNKYGFAYCAYALCSGLCYQLMHSVRWAIFLQQSTSALCLRKCPRRRWCCASRECTVLREDMQIASMCSRCLVVMARRGQEPVRHATAIRLAAHSTFSPSQSPLVGYSCSSYSNLQAIDSRVWCLLFHADIFVDSKPDVSQTTQPSRPSLH